MGSRRRTVYTKESWLVADFARCLRQKTNPWGPLRIAFEFEYGGGTADILAVRDGAVFAFEAKLTKWRDALHQAYRTRCFANRAYVVLPLRAVARVAAYEFEFQRRRVGLCTISTDGAIVKLIESVEGAPLQPWIAERAVTAISSKGDRWQQIRGSSKLHQPSALIAA
jgi:hypothetical protein